MCLYDDLYIVYYDTRKKYYENNYDVIMGFFNSDKKWDLSKNMKRIKFDFPSRNFILIIFHSDHIMINLFILTI